MCVPCQILLWLANAGQGKPGGRAAAPCRGAAAARGVSGKSVQATATVHPSGAVPARSDAKAGGASAGGGAGRSGGWGWEPAIHGSYVFEFGLGSSHQGHRIGATTCLPSHGVAGGWRRGLEAGCGGWLWGAGAGCVRVRRCRARRAEACERGSAARRSVSAVWPACAAIVWRSVLQTARTRGQGCCFL